MRCIPIVFMMGGGLLAQTPATPAFEVATIRPAPPINPVQIAQGKLHIGMKVDAARVDIGFMSLAELIRTAYDVKAWQVSGPDWLNAERFDIMAKMPDGATKEQVPAMLKALLADRFKLTAHKENKEHAVYALIAGKNGPKLKDAPPDPETGPDGAPPGKGGLTVDTPGRGPVRINPDRDGKGAIVSSASGGTTKMSVGSDGNMRMEMSKIAMPAFADMVTRFVDRPVIDETGLKGNYQVTLELPMAALQRMAASAGIMAPGMMPGPAAGAPAAAASDPGAGASIFEAVQQLGLKLDPRKEPIETIIVDHIEKTPTEN